MATSPSRSVFGGSGGEGGLARSSSSQSSFFGTFSNENNAHGLSNLGSSIGAGIGTGGGDEVGGQNREANKSRASNHSSILFSQPRRPYGEMAQRSFSQDSMTQGIHGGGSSGRGGGEMDSLKTRRSKASLREAGGEMNSLKTRRSKASLRDNGGELRSLKTQRSRASLHDTVTGATATAGSNTSIHHHPFSTSRSNSFVDTAVAEAGFTGSQREILEAETNSSKKFYDRRDFDSKIIEVDSSSGSDLWRRQHRTRDRERSLGGSTSLHGMQALSADAAMGGGGGMCGEGLDERILDSERRSKSQVVVPRRKMSMGTRMRNSIFGRGRGREQSSDSEDDEEADTE